jgi:hypothetical protein
MRDKCMRVILHMGSWEMAHGISWYGLVTTRCRHDDQEKEKHATRTHALSLIGTMRGIHPPGTRLRLWYVYSPCFFGSLPLLLLFFRLLFMAWRSMVSGDSLGMGIGMGWDGMEWEWERRG